MASASDNANYVEHYFMIQTIPSVNNTATIYFGVYWAAITENVVWKQIN